MNQWLWIILGLCTTFLSGEEGLWLLNELPREKIFEVYGVKLEDSLLEHIQKACLRISAGGSGSFISPNGLVMTNHHVGASALYNLSTPDCNLLEKGFYAKNLEEELVCENFYVDQLLGVSDITEQVNQGIQEGLSLAEKERMRKTAIALIQQQIQDKTGLQPEIITLYEGAQYHLYLYKRYTDVRLVMAPEKSIAFLGGDQDNFEYPRYCLDKCFFRVYEHEKPLQVEHYFPWSPTGPVEGELLIVAGHPGKTRRMWSADHLRFFQEVEIPLVHQFLQERLQMLKRFAATSPEHARIAGHSISKVSNAHKVYQGLKQNLGEKERDLFERREALLCRFGMGEKDSPWSLLKESLEETKKYIREFFVLEGMGSHYCKLYGLAKTFVRLAQEKQLPSEKRLLEYTDPYLEKLERELLSQEPIYPEFEAICLEEGLERVKAILGRAHPLLQASILEESPQGILQGSKMHSLEDRTFLFHHLDEVLSSQDPLLVLAREMDPYARTLRKEKEDKLEATQHECYANIAQKALDFYGVSLYPDATFSLRLSYGQMKGYQDVCSMTTLEGMQRKSELPASWRGENFLKVNPKIGLNFVSTHDTIGGNSGSPVLNARGEWVGLVFDGNAHSIAWSYLFDDALGRTISVHSEGMMEALEKIYQAYALTEEIRGAVNL